MGEQLTVLVGLVLGYLRGAEGAFWKSHTPGAAWSVPSFPLLPPFPCHLVSSAGLEDKGEDVQEVFQTETPGLRQG